MILRNASFRLLAMVINFAAVMVTAPILVHHLGQSVYGIWLLILSISGFTALLDFGVTSGFNNHIAADLHSGNLDSFNKTFNSAATIFLIVGLAIFAIHLVAAFFCTSLFDFPPDQVGTAITSLIIVGFAFALGFPSRLFEGLLLASERHWVLAVNDVASASLRLGLIIVFIANGYGIVALAMIHSAALLLTYIVSLAFGLRVLPKEKWFKPCWPRARFKELLSYGRDTMLELIGYRLRIQGSTMLLGTYSAIGVAQYGLGMRLIDYLRLTVVQAVSVAQPRFVNYLVNGQMEQCRELLIRSCTYGTLFSMWLCVSLGFMGGPFIRLLVGDGFEDTVLMLQILALPSLVYLMTLPMETLLKALGRHRMNGWAQMFEAVCTLATTLLLAEKLGALAPVVGLAISTVLLRPFLLTFVSCRALELSVSRFLLHSSLRPLICGLVGAAVLGALCHLYPIISWPVFLAVGTSFTVFFGLLCYVVGLSGKERKFLVGTIRQSSLVGNLFRGKSAS